MLVLGVMRILQSGPWAGRGIVQNSQRPLALGVAGHLRQYSSLVLGQPSAATHPHLMKNGELTPGTRADEYDARRARLMAALPENSLALIAGHPLRYMSADIPYRFRQHTDFSYLCGFQEPDALLLLKTGPRGTPGAVTLVVPPKDPSREMWDGPRAGVAAAMSVFGAQQAHANSELRTALRAGLSGARAVFYMSSEPAHPAFHTTILEVLGGRRIESLQRILHHMRLTKSSTELAIMRRAADISSEAFIETMQATRPGVSENELDSVMEHACRMRGCQRLAYPPVVAAGNRCNTLHYIANDRIIEDGDLVLMDAGGELYDYASDITRTWPANGKFTDAQAEVYEAVLTAQVELVTQCRSDQGMTLDKLHNLAVLLLGKGLQRLRILPEKSSDADLMRYTNMWYPHHTSHYLGMDTHDTMTVSRSRLLEPGYVVTVEPGLYFDEADQRVPERYRGIGVRIEDDVVVTDGDPEVLTAKCPKTIDDIERVMYQRPRA